MRWIVVAVACGGICGCSSSAYDAAYTKRVGEHRVAGEFAPLRPTAMAVADGRAELRLPTILVNQLDGSETPARAVPPFIRDFPGFAVAYEAQVDATDGRYPIVLTVGVVPAADRPKEKVAEAILAQVRADEEFGKATWRKGQSLGDESAALGKWDVLELKGPQPFQVTKADITAEKRLPGTTEIWLSAEPGQKACVILAWRVPDDVAASLPVPKISQLTARTVRLVEP
jgi:hypothetical protein